MIRAAIHYLAAPVLGRLGVAVIRAAHEESARADAAELNEAHALGARNEARDQVRYSRHERDAVRDELVEKNDQILTLSAEVDRLRVVESNGLADDEAHTFAREALEETKAERDRLSAELQAEVNHRRRLLTEAIAFRARIHELEEQVGRAADVAPVESVKVGDTFRRTGGRRKGSVHEVTDILTRTGTTVTLAGWGSVPIEWIGQGNEWERVDAVDVAPVEAKADGAPPPPSRVCAWCDSVVNHKGDTITSSFEGPGTELPMCEPCYLDTKISKADIRAKARAR